MVRINKDIGKVSPKKALLVMASLALMALSSFVDGALDEESIREIVKEELKEKAE